MVNPLGIKIDVDATQFQAAIHEYAAFDKRTLPEIMTAKLGDWAWESAKSARRTTKEFVRSILSAPWWWPFVQSVAYSGRWFIKGRRKATAAEAAQGYIDAPTGEWRSARRTVGTQRRVSLETGIRKGDLEKLSRSIIGRRASKVKSFVAMFLYAAQKMKKDVYAMDDKGSAQSRYRGVIARKAAPAPKPSALLSIPWRASTLEHGREDGKRDSKSAQKANIALQAINAARETVIADMQRITAKRYARKAAQLSGRAA